MSALRRWLIRKLAGRWCVVINAHLGRERVALWLPHGQDGFVADVEISAGRVGFQIGEPPLRDPYEWVDPFEGFSS